MKMVSLKALLKQVKREETIHENKNYDLVGIRWYANGLFIKNSKKGSQIKAKKLYKIRKGDFIYSRLFAWKGSFGLVDQNFDGCYVSNEFPCFKIDNTKVLSEYLRYLFFDKSRWEQSLEYSEGSTAVSRNRLKIDRFLGFEIPLPSIDDQRKMVNKLKLFFSEMDNMETIQSNTSNDVDKLRQSLLSLAIQGELVKQDPRDEPASVLIKRIEKEKQRLVKEKKIRKPNNLPEITNEEKPYGLPQGWEWVRISEVFQMNPRNSIDDQIDVSFIPMKFIQDGYGGNHSSEIRQWGDVKRGFTHFQEKDIAIAKITPCFENKKSAVMENLENGYGAGTTELHILRNYIPEVIPEFFLYLFKTDTFIDKGVNTYTGTAGQQRVKKDFVESYVVGLPPANEQRRIIAKIDSLFAQCDQLEYEIENRKQNASLLRQAVLTKSLQMENP